MSGQIHDLMLLVTLLIGFFPEISLSMLPDNLR